MNDSLADWVVGHEQAVNLLSQAMAADSLSQALLIVGLPQVGKTTLARTVAMAVNCSRAVAPCGECSSCRKMLHGSHPDVTLFDETGQSLKIEQIRSLQHNLALKPHESRYKIAILSDFERATPAAANALLKTLEEPPPHVFLILTCRDATLLLSTIVSRCQIIHLKPVSSQRIASYLQARWQAPADQAALLSALAAGRIGWAVTALQNPETLERREQYLADLLELIEAGYAFRLTYAYDLLRSNPPLVEVFNLWLTWWRDVLLITHDNVDQVVNLDCLEKLAWCAENLGSAQIVDAIDRTHQALANLRYNVNHRLNLEVLLLNLPSLTAVQPIRS